MAHVWNILDFRIVYPLEDGDITNPCKILQECLESQRFIPAVRELCCFVAPEH